MISRLKFWILAGVSFAVVTAVVIGPGRTGYRHLKEQRDLIQAQAAFTSGDYAQAALSVRQVLALNPTNAAACRVMAEIADRSQSPATLDWRRRLAEIFPSAENKLQLAEAGLRYQSPPFPLTEQILQELSATATNLAFFHVVAAEYAVARRQLNEAEGQLAAAVRLAPTNQLYQLNLAMVELSSTNSAALKAARARLNSFVADANYAPVALRALIADRLAHDDVVAAQTFSEQLLRTPQATLPDRLQHLVLLRKKADAGFPAQLDALQKTAATNASMVVQMALWMQANGLATNAVQWFSGLPKNLRTQPPVLLVTAAAIEAEPDWPALRQFCAAGNWADLDFLRLAFLAHAWAQLGGDLVARSNWHLAVNAAGNRFGALTSLLELTARWKWADERLDLFWLLFQKFPRERWVAAALQQHCYSGGDTAGLRRIFQQLAVTFPDRPEIKNDLAYTSLLLRTNLVESGNIAAKLHAQLPDDPTIASTDAFALHLQGRDADGLAIMQKMDRAALEQPALALHYGILLSATGDKTGAEHYLAVARGSTGLLPEEKQLCQPASDNH